MKNKKILIIFWVISIVLEFFFSPYSSTIYANDRIGIIHTIAGFIGHLIGLIAPGALVGLVFLFFAWLIKRNLDKAFKVGIITAIIVNFIMIWLFS